jgi:hypothetical protein
MSSNFNIQNSPEKPYGNKLKRVLNYKTCLINFKLLKEKIC